MIFKGEHLLPGQLGQLLISISLLASVLAGLAYFNSSNTRFAQKQHFCLRFGRIAFIVQTLAVMAAFLCLYYITANHFFEYRYVWLHSSYSLEKKYLLACLWEGQEGSFLLWSFWHCVIGIIIILKSGKWEGSLMVVLNLAQTILFLMLAGFYISGYKIGSSPFVLLRQEELSQFFKHADYLSLIKDGNGLNPLLQNYWMTIHPPVLFLGFAAFIVPFAYAVAGLYKREYREWIKPSMPWALFAACTLGVGITMGMMWAYESLTFGGYWIWDPVENASLVPWLLMVAAIHAMLISKNTGYSIKSSFFLVILSFLFILYSTFLTRSGILGDTSIHAFTTLGMNTQLLVFLFIFAVPSILLFSLRYRNILYIKKEELGSSREWWMFIGAMLLAISALSIISMTSIPVVNKIMASLFYFGDKTFKPLAIGKDAEYSYNKVQIIVSILLGVLTATTQYLSYKNTPAGRLRRLILPFSLTLIISLPIIFWGHIRYTEKGLLFMVAVFIAMGSNIYAIVSNVLYIWKGFKGKLHLAASAITHIGFSLMVIGILISSSEKEIISAHANPIRASRSGEMDMKGESVTIFKDIKTSIGDYWVTYKGDSSMAKTALIYYNIAFERKDKSEKFTLRPNSFVNYKGNEGLISNPDSKHYWNRDLFVYITSVSEPPLKQSYHSADTVELNTGDTLHYLNKAFILQKYTQDRNDKEKEEDSVSAIIKVITNEGAQYTLELFLANPKIQGRLMPVSINPDNLLVQLNKITENGVGITISPPIADDVKFITLKAMVNPFINLVWAGALLMALGFILGIRRKVIGLKNTKNGRI